MRRRMAIPDRGLLPRSLSGGRHAPFPLSALRRPSPRPNRHLDPASLPPGRLLTPLSRVGAVVQLDPGRRHRRYPLAIDIHAIAYFKRGGTPPSHVRKGKPRPGTAYGHHYASASLLRKGQYYIVALTPFDPGESTAALVRRLLRQATANGFAPRYVLMDRGFWSADVFRYLQQARYPFLIPVMPRGKRPRGA